MKTDFNAIVKMGGGMEAAMYNIHGGLEGKSALVIADVMFYKR